jgi:hypothetical protein
LELGLGAREWGSCFSTDLVALLDGGEAALIEAVGRVGEENPFEGDSEDEAIEEAYNNITAYQFPLNVGMIADGVVGAGAGEGTVTTSIRDGDSSQLTVFSSPAAAYLQSREWQGLQRAVPEGHSTEVHTGHYGVAAGYVRNEEAEAEAEGASAATAADGGGSGCGCAAAGAAAADTTATTDAAAATTAAADSTAAGASA